MQKIIYPELGYKLNGAFYEVHNKLGRFCREKQYADELERILKRLKIRYEREKPIEIADETTGNILDFLIENKIVVDIKAKKYVTREDYFQMKRYLQSSRCKLGLIVNFRERALRPKRVVNSLGKER